jgi:hypothetical protein
MYFIHAVVDDMQKPLELRYGDVSIALDQACALISCGAVDVLIQDGLGNRIEGFELAACCRGERILNNDLSSKQNHSAGWFSPG